MKLRFEGIRAILHNKDHYVVNNSDGIDEPFSMTYGWCSHIGRNSNTVEMLLTDNAFQYLCLSKIKPVPRAGQKILIYFGALIEFTSGISGYQISVSLSNVSKAGLQVEVRFQTMFELQR